MGILMCRAIRPSYVKHKVIYIPVEYLSDFPDVGEPFVVVTNDGPYSVTLDSVHRIKKLTEWFNNNNVAVGDTIELATEDRKEYLLKHIRNNGQQNKTKESSKVNNAISSKKSIPYNKRQVEVAAIEYVKLWLKKQGIDVRDAEGEGCDLKTIGGDYEDEHYIEVKGSSNPTSPIMIYESIFEFLKNEGVSPNKYYIYIVSDIAKEPKLRIITPEKQEWQEMKIRVLENQSFKNAKPHSLAEYRTQVEQKLADKE